MLKIQSLNHVSIYVSDVARSTAFYAEQLGLQLKTRPAFDFLGAWFALGANQELHLIGGRNEAVTSGTRSNHFALQVESVAAAQAFLIEQKVAFFPPKQRPDGVWQLFLKDPDGYYLELCGNW